MSSENRFIPASQLEALQAELQAERKANIQEVARFQAELRANAETLASLKAEKEQKEELVGTLTSKLKTKEEAVRKLQTVVGETSSDSTTATSIAPFDRDNPGVKKVGGTNVLVKSTTTNTCSFNVDVHEVPEALLEALLNDQTKVDKTLFQQVIEEGVAYWSFMVNNTKSCDLLLRMQVERQEEAGAVVRVESVKEEGESGDEG